MEPFSANTMIYNRRLDNDGEVSAFGWPIISTFTLVGIICLLALWKQILDSRMKEAEDAIEEQTSAEGDEVLGKLDGVSVSVIITSVLQPTESIEHIEHERIILSSVDHLTCTDPQFNSDDQEPSMIIERVSDFNNSTIISNKGRINVKVKSQKTSSVDCKGSPGGRSEDDTRKTGVEYKRLSTGRSEDETNLSVTPPVKKGSHVRIVALDNDKRSGSHLEFSSSC